MSSFAVSRPATPTAAIAVTVLLWASAFVAIRHVGGSVSPGALTLGRCVIGSLALGVLLLARRARGAGVPRPTRAHWPRLLVVGVLWFGVYNVALNAAERRVDAGTAAMLVNIGPVLIAVLAGVLLREGFPGRLVTGGLVALAGVVVIGTASGSHSVSLAGVALCVLAAVVYAVAVVAQKPLLADLPALEVTWIACTVGAVCCLPFGPDLVRDVRTAGISVLGWVAYLGLMPTAVAFTTWAYALARSTAGRLGASTYLVPPIAIVLGWVLLGERPAALALAGGAVCLVGVAIARRRPRVVASVEAPEPVGAR